MSRPSDYRREYVPGIPQSSMLGSDSRYGVIDLAGPGGGKSTRIDAALCDAVRHGHPVIALATDRTLAHKLASAVPRGSRYQVHMVDPTVRGGKALDYTRLWDTQANRLRCAKFLSPVRDGDHQSFFAQFGQEVALFAASHLSGRDCRLGDLPGVCNDPELMDALGDALPEFGPSPWRLTGIHSRSGRDCRATVQVALRQLMIYAGLSQGPHIGGLVDPLQVIHGEPCAIVLVLDETFKHALEGLFAFAFEAVIEAKIAAGGDESRQLHVGLDELPSLARMDVVPTLSRRARKAYCCYYLGAQSVASVKARYPKDWSDILSLARFKVFGTLYDRESATFASDCCGVRLVKERIAPEAYDPMGLRDGSEYKVSVVERPLFHWGTFLDVPLADWGRDEMCGVLCWPGPEGKLPFKARFRHFAQTSTPPHYEAADPRHQVLPPMTPMDHARLGFPTEALRKADEARERNRRRQEGGGKKGNGGFAEDFNDEQ